MWPFKKKEDTDLSSFERELGLSKESLAIPDKPQEESFDQFASKGLESPTFETKSMYEQPKTTPLPPQQTNSSDLQVISAKLDTIKAMLDLLNQRINTLERHAEDKQKQKLW